MARKFEDLTEKQQAVITAALGECKGNITEACKVAGLSNPTVVIRQLREELIEAAEVILAKGAMASAFTLVEAASGEADFIGNTRLDAAKQVLDRVGLSRKDVSTLNIETPNGIFILPQKAPISD